MEDIKFDHASAAKCLSSYEQKHSYFKHALKWVNIIKTDQFWKAVRRENVASCFHMGAGEGAGCDGWTSSAELQHAIHLVCR